jgi:putative transposase
MRTAYRCRAYPDEAQQQVLARTFGCVRVVWNRTLAARLACYATDRKSASYAETDRALTAMKKDLSLAFLNEVSSVPLQPPAPPPLEEAGRAVGVDLGVKDLAVTSDGDRIANPRHLERRARNLARYQRRMARCRKGSVGRRKAAAKVARAHRKVRDARRDFLHRASTRLVREHDVIVTEDLNVSGMVRNRTLARAISDCGWGEFRRQLEYKCAWYGRSLIVIDRWFPSSKTCSACGHLLADLSLSTRHWTCPSCRAQHDRDVNAAKNILAAGLAVSACGAGVRLQGASLQRPTVKQEPELARAGIPVPQGGD